MSDKDYASSVFTSGQLNAMVKKLGGRQRARLFLKGQFLVDYKKLEAVVNQDDKVSLESFMGCFSFWEEKGGVIYFSVTSDGTTGLQWIDRLRGFGWIVSAQARRLLSSPDFKPTAGVTTKIAILKGNSFSDARRKTREIYHDASLMKFDATNAEVACLFCEVFSGKDIVRMGLGSITVIHPPINDEDNGPSFISITSGHTPFLHGYSSNPDVMWNDNCGFAFEVKKK